MLDVIKTRKIWFVLSGAVIIAGIIALALFGLNFGVDFRGGSFSEIKFTSSEPEPSQIQEALTDLSLGNIIVQKTAEGTYNVRTRELSSEEHESVLSKLSTAYGETTELRFTNIGPTISSEITRRAVYQLLLVTAGILAYIAWAFRKVPRPLSSWRFGWAAIAALIHDVLVVVGVFAILGQFLNVEIDALFVTALLTVLGFSVHDTIIVFDRIRENLRRLSSLPFAEVVSRSINQTIVRSINTSTTVIFVLLALLLFGGESIRYFTLALLIGIVAGTYSSIFFASPLLYIFHKKRFL